MTIFVTLVGVFIFALVVLGTLLALSLNRKAGVHDIVEAATTDESQVPGIGEGSHRPSVEV